MTSDPTPTADPQPAIESASATDSASAAVLATDLASAAVLAADLDQAAALAPDADPAAALAPDADPAAELAADSPPMAALAPDAAPAAELALIADPTPELRAREPIFHRPEWGFDYASMITDDYWEVGASGRRYSRADVLAVLAERVSQGERDDSDASWEVSDFACLLLGPEVYLVTYTLRQDSRLTRRSTIWLRSGRGWRARFHQGTVVADEPRPTA